MASHHIVFTFDIDGSVHRSITQ